MPRGLLILALLAPTVLSGCLLFSGRHWDEARREQIEPINSTLHRHLPRDIQAKDLTAILGIYHAENVSGPPWDDFKTADDGHREQRLHWRGTPTAVPTREHFTQLLSLFDTLDRSEVRIHRIYWDQRVEAGYPAEIRLIARGVRTDGRRAVLDQRSRAWIDRVGNAWKITREEVTARELVATDEPYFATVTEAVGMIDTHDVSTSPIFRLIGGTQACSGAAIADVDCDGFEDVALLSTDRLRLFRNRADGTFTDATHELGFDVSLGNVGTGLVFFDADNDGDPDLWIAGIRGERFFVNDGCRRFRDATATAGIGPSRWSSMPIVADYDRDGDLDVYVVRMGDHENGTPEPNWNAKNGLGDSLYRNDGNGRFTDVSAAAGIDGRGWGLAGAWGDYDGDLYPDVYIGNEFGENSLYRNNGDGTFAEVAEAAGALDRGAAMGVVWGDYDNDGDLDLFVSNMYANSRWAMFHPEFPAPVPWYFSWVPRSDVDRIVDELTRGSTLLSNNGDGTFTDVSEVAGIRDSQWGWAAEFLDYNNDGRIDIFAANGFVTGPQPDDV